MLPDRLLRPFSPLAASMLVSSCMLVGVDYTSPDAITPDAWHQSLTSDLSSGSSSLEKWWTRFNDSRLNRLIDVAREQNRDLAIAYERINQARAARGVARSGLFPQIDATGGFNRGRTSENVGNPFGGVTNNLWSTGLDAGWELDFFGAVRRSIESADASVAATEELYRDTVVSLLAEVAFAYIEIRTFEQRIVYANENIGIQEGTLKLTQERFDAGLVPELDVSQAQTNLETTKSALPALRNQRDIALNRLAVLLGKYPSAAAKLVGSGGIPSPSRSAGIGIPADLVRSRPDIRAAERQLAAQTARIGVAEGDLLPRFTLSGTFQLQAIDANNLAESNSRNYGFGPSFRWNIFNAGRIKSQIDIEKSLTKQAYYNYENAVLKGVSEVESALSSVRNERQRKDALEGAVRASGKAVELVKANYTEGLINFQSVLDAERTIFSNQDSLATSQGQIAAAYVSLFKALGGGTRIRSAKSPSDS